MDRKFCDICGNEIIGDYKVANITTGSTYDIPGGLSIFAQKVEICIECYKDILEFVKINPLKKQIQKINR